jgi:hypothetical protein
MEPNPYESPREASKSSGRYYSGVRIVLVVLLLFFDLPLIHFWLFWITAGFPALKTYQAKNLAVHVALMFAISIALNLMSASDRREISG